MTEFGRLLCDLQADGVRFVVVGGIAVIAHGVIRATRDLDAARAATRRIDGVAAPLCSLADLAALKRASGRPQDPDDLRLLERAHGGLPGPPAT